MLTTRQLNNQVEHCVVTDSHNGQRIDNFLLTRLRGLPKSRLYRIIRKGEVRVNKGRVDVSYRLKTGDNIRIPPVRLGAVENKIAPSQSLIQKLEQSICYEDEQLLVIDKPSGLAVHGGSGISLGLIEAIRAIRPANAFLELVHRIDRDTSGCVMIAKKRSMLIYLHECLKTGKIQKRYQLLVQGQWKGGKVVDAPLEKYILSSGERLVKVTPEGKPSKTLFRVLEHFANASLLEAKPVTGRTHQIRVHCQFMGNPIIGDTKYGGEVGKRLFLHAHQLIIPMPNEQNNLTITVPLPAVCQEILTALKSN